MTVYKVLLSGVIALTLVPAAAQAASVAGPAHARSSAASSLSLSSSVRVGAHSGKKSHALIAAIGLPLFLAGAVAVTVGVVAAAGGFSSNKSGG
jgi:hypothetical protein